MKTLLLIFALVPTFIFGQVSRWRTDPPKFNSRESTQSSPRNDNISHWRNTPQPSHQQNNTPIIQHYRHNTPYRYNNPYYYYGRHGWYYPSYYYWHDPYGFRNRNRVYIYENGNTDTIKITPTRFSIGIQQSNNMLGIWSTIGNDGFLILDYITTYKQDNSQFFPYGKITEVDFPMVSDYIKRNVFYIGGGKTLDRKWKLSVSVGFGREVVRYRGKDSIGYITFPKYSENFTTVKLGVIRNFNKVSCKLDYDPNKKYLSLGFGLNF